MTLAPTHDLASSYERTKEYHLLTLDGLKRHDELLERMTIDLDSDLVNYINSIDYRKVNCFEEALSFLCGREFDDFLNTLSSHFIRTREAEVLATIQCVDEYAGIRKSYVEKVLPF